MYEAGLLDVYHLYEVSLVVWKDTRPRILEYNTL